MVITGQTAKAKQALGFRAGLAQVRMGDYSEVREELMNALGIANRNSLAAYASGRQEMKVTQAEAVEAVFNRYGITRNIWGLWVKLRGEICRHPFAYGRSERFKTLKRKNEL